MCLVCTVCRCEGDPEGAAWPPGPHRRHLCRYVRTGPSAMGGGFSPHETLSAYFLPFIARGSFWTGSWFGCLKGVTSEMRTVLFCLPCFGLPSDTHHVFCLVDLGGKPGPQEFSKQLVTESPRQEGLCQHRQHQSPARNAALPCPVPARGSQASALLPGPRCWCWCWCWILLPASLEEGHCAS